MSKKKKMYTVWKLLMDSDDNGELINTPFPNYREAMAFAKKLDAIVHDRRIAVRAIIPGETICEQWLVTKPKLN